MSRTTAIPIRIPTIWSCKVSFGWLNLADVRKIQPASDTKGRRTILITWNSDKEEVFIGDDAETIMHSWLQAVEKYIKPFERN